MVVNVKVTMEQDEFNALGKLAFEDMRSIPDQARFIIRKELELKGLLQNQTIREKQTESKNG